MNLHSCCSEKVVTPEEAISHIKPGSRVFLGSACGEPRKLIDTMVADIRLQDILIYQMLSFGLADYMDDQDFLDRFSLKMFFISATMRKAAFEGKIDYVPAYLSEIPDLFNSRQIGLDVALIQVSPPDRFGLCSLGVSVDVTRAGSRNARMVIAQVNPLMPRSFGDTFIHVDEIDWLVPFEEPLFEAVPYIPDPEVASRIAHYVLELVEDGSTLQIGFGRLPYAILQAMETKNDLGIHTQMITDAFIPLFEKGVITNRKKTYMPDKAVATLCMGSRLVYDFVDNNPRLYFQPSDVVNNPSIVAQNDNLISISSALEVDITGQVCADSVGHLFYSGIGDQANFIRGAAMSKGGFSIIALPSTAKNGEVSRIVSTLSEGAGVATLRADVNFVVTEYGIAQLRGKSIYQRVMELAQIAHPDFRESLIESAKRHHYIYPDQASPRAEDLRFIETYNRSIPLRNGKNILIRPILPTDEFAYRNFFYSLKEETIFHRFFRRIRTINRETAQRQWEIVDYRKNMSLIGLVRSKGHKEIVAIGSFLEDTEDRAEIAFVVREDFQGQGVASHLLKVLEEIAVKNGYKGFSALVMFDNKPMFHVLKRRYPDLKILVEEGNARILMNFRKGEGKTDEAPARSRSSQEESGDEESGPQPPENEG